MKTIKAKFFIFLFVSAFAFPSYCQPDNIVANAKPFKHLIGKEYSDVSELGDFELKSRSSESFNGDVTSSSSLTQREKQIITSEKTTRDKVTNKEVHKILDIIVLDGYFTTCEGCLLSNKKNNTIKSIYTFGNTNKESILVAFERNGKTGKYKILDPEKLKRNPNQQTGVNQN